MKAFKQINFSFEYRVVFSYAAVLCLASFLIILSPVLAQDDYLTDPIKPEVKIDIKKQIDELGNITFFDSVYSWSWNGQDIPVEKLDSIFGSLHKSFENLGLKDFNLPLGSFDDQWFFNGLPNDTADISYFNFDDLNGLLDENFNIDEFLPNDELLKNFQFKNEEFMDRFRQYHEEHQKLIEKYFKHHIDDVENNTENEPNNYFPGNKKSSDSNTGKI